jgi:hypothetical protein
VLCYLPRRRRRRFHVRIFMPLLSMTMMLEKGQFEYQQKNGMSS